MTTLAPSTGVTVKAATTTTTTTTTTITIPKIFYPSFSSPTINHRMGTYSATSLRAPTRLPKMLSSSPAPSALSSSISTPWHSPLQSNSCTTASRYGSSSLASTRSRTHCGSVIRETLSVLWSLSKSLIPKIQSQGFGDNVEVDCFIILLLKGTGALL